MTKYKRLMVIVVLIIGFVLIGGHYPSSLLTQELNAVTKITVVYHRNDNKTHELYLAKDNDLMQRIYQLIDSTKVRVNPLPSANQEQTNDPQFTIIVEYENGSKDTILATETGEFLYRRLTGAGWAGGHNKEINTIVKNL